jgi:hypothetical protein
MALQLSKDHFEIDQKNQWKELERSKSITSINSLSTENNKEQNKDISQISTSNSKQISPFELTYINDEDENIENNEKEKITATPTTTTTTMEKEYSNAETIQKTIQSKPKTGIPKMAFNYTFVPSLRKDPLANFGAVKLGYLMEEGCEYAVLTTYVMFCMLFVLFVLFVCYCYFIVIQI